MLEMHRIEGATKRNSKERGRRRADKSRSEGGIRRRRGVPGWRDRGLAGEE